MSVSKFATEPIGFRVQDREKSDMGGRHSGILVTYQYKISISSISAREGMSGLMLVNVIVQSQDPAGAGVTILVILDGRFLTVGRVRRELPDRRCERLD